MLRGAGYTLALLVCTLWIVIAAVAPVVWRALVLLAKLLLWAGRKIAKLMWALVPTISRPDRGATERQIDYLVDLYRDVEGREKSPADFAGWSVEKASAKIDELAAQR
jgi:hypothetical protein